MVVDIATPLRVAVLGWGHWGPHLGRNVAAAAGGQLVAIADPIGQRLAAARADYPFATIVDDSEALLSRADIDAVVVAAPVAQHFHLVQSALRTGKHVLVEKTLARSVAEASILVEEAARRELVLMVDHTFLFAPALRVVRQLIRAGTLGELSFVEAWRLNMGIVRDDVSVMWDLASHDLAILNDVITSSPTTVRASDSSSRVRPLDGSMVLSYGGAEATIHASWASPTKTRRVVFGGSDAVIVWDEMADDKVVVCDPEAQRSEGQPALRVRSTPSVSSEEPLRAVVDHFVACVRHRLRPTSDGRAGLRVVRQLEAADQSRRESGRAVTLASEYASA